MRSPKLNPWSSYGLAVVTGLAAAVGCGTDGSTGPAADYALSLTPGALTIVQGGTRTASVTITRTNFTDAVTLSLVNAPAGITGSFDPAASPATASTLTVSVGAAVAPGVYNLTVSGTASVGNRGTPLALTVNLSDGGGSIATVDAGYEFSCALNRSGQAYCWGRNYFGVLGDGTTTDRLVPTPVAGGLTFTALSAGNDHACGLTTSGAAYCWGRWYLDDGTTVVDHLVPTPVAEGITFASLRVGVFATCGVTASGAAYCWGGNADGENGDGTTTPRFVPTPVAGGVKFAVVTNHMYHTCGVTPSGAAYCWGSGAFGRLGDGTGINQLVPTPVAGGLIFTAVDPGWWHTCGVTNGGRAYCWGDGSHVGLLGDGTTASFSGVPAPVSGGLTFTVLSVGTGFNCGVTSSGAAYCWGYNAFGMLGDGTLTTRLIPTPVSGGLSFTAVSAGREVEGGHACGVTTSGAAYCWGENAHGALGDGTTTDRLVPTAVAFR